MKSSNDKRRSRKARIRKKISGNPERPRLSVFRTANHIYAQIVDDTSGVTLASASTLLKGVGDEGTKVDKAKSVGAAVAKACLDRGITTVVFDRNGFLYHGRIRALAESAREAGLTF